MEFRLTLLKKVARCYIECSPSSIICVATNEVIWDHFSKCLKLQGSNPISFSCNIVHEKL